VEKDTVLVAGDGFCAIAENFNEVGIGNKS
jgi:hypothetical protein